MENINLNVGGLIGGVAGVLLVGGGFTLVFIVNPSKAPDDSVYSLSAKALVLAIIFGAVGGNYLWSKFYPPPPDPPKDDEDKGERYY